MDLARFSDAAQRVEGYCRCSAHRCRARRCVFDAVNATVPRDNNVVLLLFPALIPRPHCCRSTYAQNQVSSFALLAEQPVVLDPVIKQLNLDESVRLSKRVTTTVPLDTVVMDISVTDTSATRGGAAIANAIGLR